MKKVLLITLLVSGLLFPQKSWIRINQLGYFEKSIKVAVLISKEKLQPKFFEFCDPITDEIIWKGTKIKQYGVYENFSDSYRLDFSDFQKPGSYYIKISGLTSPNFIINNDVYTGTADFLLNYFRQQQSGYNPFLKDSCHTKDGFIVYYPKLDSTYINVFGGWHNASDNVQYAAISANAVFQLLFAYQQNPLTFKDEFDKNGDAGTNGIPDIIDQAKWGLDWLVKMNPSAEIIFNQIGDDRDLKNISLPNKEKTDYGKGSERPVYFCSGKPQGFFQYKNNSNGLASTAGKFASAFALGSQILRNYYPEFSEQIKKKAVEIYNLGKKYPGVCQTTPCVTSDYLEEENYADDMELAAIQLFQISNDKKYIDDALKFGNQESISPWMGTETLKNYQSFPFINLGHYYLGKDLNKKVSKKYVDNLKAGIEKIYQKGKSNPFLIGIPFVNCSNNLLAATLTQSRLYFELTGDSQYQEIEAALRDWLFGCNPWGISMITGLPENRENPKNPFSAIQSITKKRVEGGLVSGPVYSSIFQKQNEIVISDDKFLEVQPGSIIYHDDKGDYLTNKPTIEGTSSLTYYFSSLQKEGEKYYIKKNYQLREGGVIRTDRSKKEIHLVFTGTDYADGADYIRKVLKRHKIKAHFFFTGDFYRKPEFAADIYSLKNEGHYLGAHSDKNLNYVSIANKDSLLITKDMFIDDLKSNFIEMEKFKIKRSEAKLFFPPQGRYNKVISDWSKEIGLRLISYSSGIPAYADTTTPDLPYYLSSEDIYKTILDYEKNNIDGLNGFILLTHVGTNPDRKDKFYRKLDNLLTELKKKGYNYTLIDQ